MTRKEPSKEATLGEVLAEVSLIDIGKMLKAGLGVMGCWFVLALVAFMITTATDSAGYGLSDVGVPDWLVWLLLGWFYVYFTTSQTSYHEWRMSWYFPKVGWLGSLILAAYFVTFVYLAIWAANLEADVERFVAVMLVWFGYPSPFILFLSAINAGHTKLMEKRLAGDIVRG